MRPLVVAVVALLSGYSLAATVSPTEVGYENIPPAASEEARKQNEIGLKHHRQGDFAAARVAFAGALELAPTFDVARYNLACSLARGHDLDGAAAELVTLLARDLPHYGERYREDADFRTLRDARQGAAVVARMAVLDATWKQSLRNGLPTVAKIDRVLRAGVYLPSSKRFIPAAPPVADTIAAILFPGDGLAISISGHESPVDRFREARIVVFPVQESPPKAYSATIPPASHYLNKLWVSAIDGRAVVRYIDQIDRDTFLPWQEIGRNGQLKDAKRKPTGEVLVVYPSGSLLMPHSAAGYQITRAGLALPHGAPIPLGKDPTPGGNDRYVAAAPDGKTAAVLSAWSECIGPDPRGVVGHVVDLVDVPRRSVRRFSTGDGAAAVAFDASGALYIQVGGTLRYLGMSTAGAGEAIPGVLIASPPHPPSCDI